MFTVKNKVSRYFSHESSVTELPDMNFGRHSHGCAGFSRDNEQVGVIPGHSVRMFSVRGLNIRYF